MNVDVLIGLQWGDEGKGKVVDFLSPHYDIVARFQGGPNAGHTLEFDGSKHVLHTVPSGIFHPATMNVIGNGVIIDPVIFAREIARIEKHGINTRKNLIISRRAHLILPSHLLLDALFENARGDNKIGSTLKGIGPTYTDKVSRQGMRIGDLDDREFDSLYSANKARHLAWASLYHQDISAIMLQGLSFAEYEQQWLGALSVIRAYERVDSEYYLNESLDNGRRILAEGAQGSMLDLDFGSYPFVTSSNTITAGVCAGLGIAPRRIGKVMGVFKAYCTRVGGGPFPTELKDETGEFLRKRGNEYGSTTGRPRRCGWLDLPALRYAIMLNGVTHLLMMKADVLNGVPEINLCTSYKVNDQYTDHMDYSVFSERVQPVYEQFRGWKQSLEGIDRFEQFPEALKTYITFLEEKTGVEVALISTGPNRNQTIIRGDMSLFGR